MRRILSLFAATVAIATFSVAADEVPQQVPVFPNLEFTALDGVSQIDLELLRGKPVLLTFWASWCGPCREELPELEKLVGELAEEGFVLVTVNMDQSPAMGMRFLQQHDIDVPAYRMDQRELSQLGLRSLPTNVLLDREGRPVQIFSGYSPEMPAEIHRLVLAMEGNPQEGENPSGK